MLPLFPHVTDTVDIILPLYRRPYQAYYKISIWR